VPILQAVPSTSSDATPPPVPLPLGSITPRLWTRPLRKLTPRTSYGYAVVWFAEHILRAPLDPWQQWVVIHLGEMLDDGRPRFRQVMVIVARQNGKTHLCKVLALYWMFVERWPLIFGTSTDLEQAKEAWEAAVDLAEETPVLAERLHARHKRVGNGQQVFWNTDRSRYKIGAANRKGGRGKSIDRAIGDELREQHDWDAYHAAYNAMNARPRAQVVYITNMGDSRAVVLNSLRKDALDALDTADQLRPVAIFEYSAPAGSHPMDPAAHAAANPQYGRRLDPDIILSAARRVAKPGADPEELAGFFTEMLCMAVTQLDPAVDPAAWERCLDPGALDLTNRAGMAVCIDVAPNLQRATLAAAQVLPDGRVRVESVAAWDGPDTLARVRAELPEWVRRIRPRALGWYPNSPAATLDADLKDRRRDGRATWPPRGVTVAEIQGDAPAVCMGFSALVDAHGVAQSGQKLLTAQVENAEKRWRDERWIFTRRGAGGGVDALYAAAGAAHLARTLPTRRQISRKVQGAG
jgi:hypothetical protein